MATKNKVKFGLSHATVFPLTVEGGKETYGTPISIPGSVSLSLSAEGSSDPFYAENQPYYVSTSNNGYSGSLEVALVPEEFFVQIMGMKKDEQSGVMIESSNDVVKEFALAFQFEGDANAIRHLLYRCKATRPSIESETTAESTTPKTESFDFTAIARQSDGKIRAKVEAGSTSYEKFFEKPFEATAS